MSNSITILVVEDDEDLRELAGATLHEAGYEILSAGDAEQAMVVLEADRRIDLLFTDIVLKRGMDGTALARRAAMTRPGLKVLYTSGFIAGTQCGQVIGGSSKLIGKPYLAHQLRETIAEMLSVSYSPDLADD
jgi:DNA-binding NtrC family response regulator